MHIDVLFHSLILFYFFKLEFKHFTIIYSTKKHRNRSSSSSSVASSSSADDESSSRSSSVSSLSDALR